MERSYLLVLAMPRLFSWCCYTARIIRWEDTHCHGHWKKYIYIYKVEDLNLQAPTGPPHSTMRQNFELWNVSFQMWRNRTQRCVVQCGHMIQEILWTKSTWVGCILPASFLALVVQRCAMFCQIQWKVSRVPVASQKFAEGQLVDHMFILTAA